MYLVLAETQMLILPGGLPTSLAQAPGSPELVVLPTAQWGEIRGFMILIVGASVSTTSSAQPRKISFFFWCYRSKEMPLLIDMSVPGLIKIPQVSREAFPGTLD